MTAPKKFNDWLAQKITSGVATMWCAYAFALLALISLPKAIQSGDVITIVSWIAQTFLQLVLLSITETHTAALGEFELAKEARKVAATEVAQLKKISEEIRQLMKDK